MIARNCRRSDGFDQDADTAAAGTGHHKGDVFEIGLRDARVRRIGQRNTGHRMDQSAADGRGIVERTRKCLAEFELAARKSRKALLASCGVAGTGRKLG